MPSSAVESRYGRHATVVDKLTQEERSQASVLGSLERRLETLDDDLRDTEIRLLRENEKRRGEILTNYKHALAAIDGRRDQTIRATLYPRENALRVAAEFTHGYDVSGPIDQWDEARARAVTMGGLIEKRLQFIRNWVREVEADASAVAACHADSIQIFFSTCVGLGSWRRIIDLGPGGIDLVIIDEAGKATVAETLISMYYARRAMLIGDEKQLPPTPPVFERKLCGDTCPKVAEHAGIELARIPDHEIPLPACWHECSLFEWLWRLRPDVPRVMLDVQFRMHPNIADFVSKVFYQEELKSGVKGEDRRISFAEFTQPICLVSTSAYKDRFEDKVEKSFRNPLEAKIIGQILKKADPALTESAEFGVITPYAEQVRLIQAELTRLKGGLKQVQLADEDIASVHSFQGSERDVIIISFVRSAQDCDLCGGTGIREKKASRFDCDRCNGKGFAGSALKFVLDLRMLNVGFTRAKKMLILVGDINGLTNPVRTKGEPGGKILAEFRDYIANRGKVLHVWEMGTQINETD